MAGFRFWKKSQSPRTINTGTSYTAKGSNAPQGVGIESGSSRGGQIRDIVPQLATRSQAARTYEEMVNSDAAVDVSLRAAKMPVMGADYFIEPASDQQIDLDIAEFVQFNLLEGQSAPFLSVLSDILTFYEFGFSIVEQVYDIREWAPKRTMANRKRYTMLKKLAARPTPTIVQINYDDNGGPLSIDQQAVDGKNQTKPVNIPIEKAIIFSHNKRGGNLEGKSLLRTAYKPWYFKSNLYNIDGIQKERHGMGFPIIELPPAANRQETEAAKELIRNVRTNEHGGVVLKPGWNLRFAELPGQPVDVMASIDHHNGMILLNTMTQFLLLGISSVSGGSRAVAGSSQDMFNKSLRYVANLICDTINLYCVPLLVSYNFKTDRFPKLHVKNVGETKDLQQWAAAVANLLAQRAITPDIETEQWVRSILDAPQKRGGAQTPIQQPAPQRGDVTSQNGGTQPLPTDQAQPTG